MDQQEKTVTIKNILVYESDITSTKQKIATQKEMVDDLKESTDGWLELQELKEQYGQSLLAFELKLQNNGEYNNALECLADLKQQLKDQKQIQSTFIVEYYADTKERQIETSGQGDARDILLKGSLGKKSKYQTSLFGKKE